MNGDVAGLILAGGKSSRFDGGDKEYAIVNGATLISHVVSRARPQVCVLGISRSRSANAFDDLPVIIDEFAGCGPIGGVHAGIIWARTLSPPVSWLATFAGDTPLLASDLVSRLLIGAAEGKAPAAMAVHSGNEHPTLALWSVELEPVIRKKLLEKAFSLRGLAAAVGAAKVSFDDLPETAFFNVNTREDLNRLADLFAQSRA